jgi:hypothetical protein
MESHEEKLHKMIIQSKINDTKDIMKRKVSDQSSCWLRARTCARVCVCVGGGGGVRHR